MKRRAARPVAVVESEARRALNDDRRRAFGGSSRAIAFICECGDADCRTSVVLTHEQFDEARPGPIFARGHGLSEN
jgi:hypothetical protein